jgi:hypothetical protein
MSSTGSDGTVANLELQTHSRQHPLGEAHASRRKKEWGSGYIIVREGTIEATLIARHPSPIGYRLGIISATYHLYKPRLFKPPDGPTNSLSAAARKLSWQFVTC